MSSAQLVPATASEARDLTDQIKVAVDGTWHLIKRAYLTRAWDALGYDSWDDYCTREFGTSRLRLPREERQEVVSSMREIGMSTRAIAVATGTNRETVRQQVAAGDNKLPPGGEPPPPIRSIQAESMDAEFWEEDELVEKVAAAFDKGEKDSTAPPPRVVGTDGKSYPAASARPARARTDVITTVNRALLRAQESARAADGITRQHLAGRTEEAATWGRSLSASLESLNRLRDLLMEASA